MKAAASESTDLPGPTSLPNPTRNLPAPTRPYQIRSVQYKLLPQTDRGLPAAIKTYITYQLLLGLGFRV